MNWYKLLNFKYPEKDLFYIMMHFVGNPQGPDPFSFFFSCVVAAAAAVVSDVVVVVG